MVEKYKLGELKTKKIMTLENLKKTQFDFEVNPSKTNIKKGNALYK